MRKLSNITVKATVVGSTLTAWSLVFVNEAFAPPGPPPPPAASSGGAVAQAAAVGLIAAYGAWRLFRKK